MQGLWVAVVTADHPCAYDPAVGLITGTERWQLGAIIAQYEGDSESVPEAGSERLGGKQYRWLFYAGKTDADLRRFLALGIDRTAAEAVKGNLRVVGYASGMQKRAGAALVTDISTAAGPREADVRAISR